jgi:hypothetical protein
LWKAALGGPEHPLTMDQVADMGRRLLDAFVAQAVSRRVEEIFVNLEKQPNVTELMDLLTLFQESACH